MATITKTKRKKIVVDESKKTTARLRFVRIAPRKVRLVAGVVRGLSAGEAEAQLLLLAKRGAAPMLKLLHSALAGAAQKNLNKARLIISELRVDEGPVLKRWMPRAQGRATPLHKKMSHITLVLAEASEDQRVRFVIEKKVTKKADGKKDIKKAEKETKNLSISKEVLEQKERDQMHKEDTKVETKTKEKPSKRFFRRKSV